jgi:drug/metabolite transporter (DMT)-like permease
MLPRSGAGLANLLALALVSQVAGQGLLAVALGSLPATFSSLVIFIEAIAAAAFGWIFLGEALGTLQFMGGILILAGIYIARPRTQPAPGAVP